MDETGLTRGDEAVAHRARWAVPLRVDVRSYLRFSRRMDLQLGRLVRRWAPAASPRARGLPNGRHNNPAPNTSAPSPPNA